MTRIRSILGMFILIIGLLMLLYPDVNHAYISYKTQKIVEYYDNDSDSMSENIVLQSVQKYNEELFENEQNNLSGKYAEINPLSSVFDDDLYGTIEIEKMDVKIPLYIGTSDEHLQNGAAIMGQTSLPLDQNNTNSVICAHRGWYGFPFFRDIELLSTGDIIKISTHFGELQYQVVSTKIVDPYDEDSIKIQDGKTMITLSTCHPYGNSSLSNRYLVYCELVDEKKESGSEIEVIEENLIEEVPSNSQIRIWIETWGRRILLALMIIILIVFLK